MRGSGLRRLLVRLALAGVLSAVAMAPAAGPALADLPVPQHDEEQVRQTAREVLSRPEYDRPGPTLVQRLRNWVAERLAQLFQSLVTGDRASLVAWLILGAAVAVAGFFGYRFSRGVTRDPAQAPDRAVEARRTPAEWRAEAAAHEAGGRWRPALRCHYRALVAELAERGVLDEVPGRTAGEYRAEVARNLPSAAAGFAGATEMFERAWYGNQPTGAGELERFKALAAQVLAQALAVTTGAAAA